MNKFELHSQYKPSGDQPTAIKRLASSLESGHQNQVLLGVTGSGKTFTMANIIAHLKKPALIMAHNKTPAAQLYTEMKGFFPENAVEYFVSYYDYYQPEAYIPQKDTYIEKDARINEQIDRLRHSATRSLLERNDTIVVSSVSCIYGLGAPDSYLQMTLKLSVGNNIGRNSIMRKFVNLLYLRNDLNFKRGTFRAKGEILDIFPVHYEDTAWRIIFFENEIESIREIDAVTGKGRKVLKEVVIFANSHYITPRMTIDQAIKSIKNEMHERIQFFESKKMYVESQRIEQRVKFDMEMLNETGNCKGIENYSRYLSGVKSGHHPPTLFEYFPKNSILFVDESHVTVPQISAMFRGDHARKNTLVNYGFRLPSAFDNRPMKFEEWNKKRPQTIFVSATPGKFETDLATEFIEQIIRPTGLLDPICTIRPTASQVDDLINEVKNVASKGEKILVTTLTKKMAEKLDEYFRDTGIKSVYLHSDVKTLERVEVIHDLRNDKYDVLIGVNLLREGLDIPECSLVAILDADKEGFLRSETSLIQTIGRAARNINGRAILYADKKTAAISSAISKTSSRRDIQEKYNKANNISPKSTTKATHIHSSLDRQKPQIKEKQTDKTLSIKELQKQAKELKKEMLKAAKNLEFEKAAKYKEELQKIQVSMEKN